MEEMRMGRLSSSACCSSSSVVGVSSETNWTSPPPVAGACTTPPSRLPSPPALRLPAPARDLRRRAGSAPASSELALAGSSMRRCSPRTEPQRRRRGVASRVDARERDRPISRLFRTARPRVRARSPRRPWRAHRRSHHSTATSRGSRRSCARACVRDVRLARRLCQG